MNFLIMLRITYLRGQIAVDVGGLDALDRFAVAHAYGLHRLDESFVRRIRRNSKRRVLWWVDEPRIHCNHRVLNNLLLLQHAHTKRNSLPSWILIRFAACMIC